MHAWLCCLDYEANGEEESNKYELLTQRHSGRGLSPLSASKGFYPSLNINNVIYWILKLHRNFEETHFGLFKRVFSHDDCYCPYCSQTSDAPSWLIARMIVINDYLWICLVGSFFMTSWLYLGLGFHFFHLFNTHVFTCIVTVIQTQLDGLYEYGKVIISLMLAISL